MKEKIPEDYMSPPYLKQAFKAFKKRLKLMKLDSESTLGGSALSGGKHSGIVAIRPPNQFPQEVWDKLVEMGMLKMEERGLYGVDESLAPH